MSALLLEQKLKCIDANIILPLVSHILPSSFSPMHLSFYLHYFTGDEGETMANMARYFSSWYFSCENVTSPKPKSQRWGRMLFLENIYLLEVRMWTDIKVFPVKNHVLIVTAPKFLVPPWLVSLILCGSLQAPFPQLCWSLSLSGPGSHQPLSDQLTFVFREVGTGQGTKGKPRDTAHPIALPSSSSPQLAGEWGDYYLGIMRVH